MLSILTEDNPLDSQAEAAQGETNRGNGIAVEQAVKPTSVLFLNIAWMVVGNVLYGLSQWAQLMVLAKLGTIEMVGTFALALRSACRF